MMTMGWIMRRSSRQRRNKRRKNSSRNRLVRDSRTESRFLASRKRKIRRKNTVPINPAKSSRFKKSI